MTCLNLNRTQLDLNKLKLLWDKWYLEEENYEDWNSIVNSTDSKNKLIKYFYSSKPNSKLLKFIYDNAFKLHICEIKNIKKKSNDNVSNVKKKTNDNLSNLKKNNNNVSNVKKESSFFTKFLNLFKKKSSSSKSNSNLNSNSIKKPQIQKNEFKKNNQTILSSKNAVNNIKNTKLKQVQNELNQERKRIKKIEEKLIRDKEIEIKSIINESERSKQNQKIKFKRAEKDRYEIELAKKEKELSEREQSEREILELNNVETQINRRSRRSRINNYNNNNNNDNVNNLNFQRFRRRNSQRYRNCNDNDINCLCGSENNSNSSVDYCKRKKCLESRYKHSEQCCKDYLERRKTKCYPKSNCENYSIARCNQNNCDDNNNCYYCYNYFDTDRCYTYDSESYSNKYVINFRTNNKSKQYSDTIEEFANKYVYFISKQLLGEAFYSDESKIKFHNENYVTILLYSNLKKKTLENKINREYNIKPYELDTYRKKVLTNYPTLHLRSFVSLQELNKEDYIEELEELEASEELEVSEELEASEELEENIITKNVLIQFNNESCKKKGKEICRNNFNKYKLNYQEEINKLLRTYNSVKTIQIVDECGMIDVEGNAILKIKFNRKFQDNLVSQLSKLGERNKKKSAIKPYQNECRNPSKCPTIKFLNKEATPILNIFEKLFEDQNTISFNFKILFKKIDEYFNNIKIFDYLAQYNDNDNDNLKINQFMNNNYKYATKIILFILNNKSILSLEALRKILKNVIFKRLRGTGADKLEPKLEELRKIAIIKLNFINYKLIEKFIEDYNFLNTHINTESLYKQWQKDKYKIISRQQLNNLIGKEHAKFFWLKNRKTLINEILNLLNITSQPNTKKIILFLIFGNYGIQPAYYLK